MNRRGFLKGLLTASAAAIAAEFSAPEWMGEEIRQELIKDASKVSVAVPNQVFDNRPIWQSVAGVKKVWVDHVRKELGKSLSSQLLGDLNSDIDRTVAQMVRAVDLDLEKARVEKDQKIIIQPPKVQLVQPYRLTTKHGSQKPIFELKAGLEERKGLFDKEFRVGYIQEALVDRAGNALMRDATGIA